MVLDYLKSKLYYNFSEFNFKYPRKDYERWLDFLENDLQFVENSMIKTSNTPLIVGLCVAAAVTAGVACFCFKARSDSLRSAGENDEGAYKAIYEEVEEIGEGAFGSVYHIKKRGTE